jgi:hypothetical protein
MQTEQGFDGHKQSKTDSEARERPHNKHEDTDQPGRTAAATPGPGSTHK